MSESPAPPPEAPVWGWHPITSLLSPVLPVCSPFLLEGHHVQPSPPQAVLSPLRPCVVPTVGVSSAPWVSAAGGVSVGTVTSHRQPAPPPSMPLEVLGRQGGGDEGGRGLWEPTDWLLLILATPSSGLAYFLKR